MSEEIKRYALNEADERSLLASLPFVGKSQADFIRNIANPIAKVRSEIHRVYTAQMAAFDADILARVAATSRPASRAAAPARDEQGAELDRLMGIAPAVADHSPRFDGVTQSFGAPPRANSQRTADALASAFGDEPATRGGSPNPNIQTFGKASR